MENLKLTVTLSLLIFFISGCSYLPTTAPQPTKLYINEFMASNNNSIADEKNEYDDWLEIYNPNSIAVDVGGMFLSDNKLKLTKWEIPKTDPTATTIPPQGFLIIWADQQTDQGILHANFRLANDGGDIALTDVNGHRLDYVRYKPQTKNTAFGRWPDGSDNWQTFKNPTPNKSNHE
ncbi:MAG: lamin tail domain-containing protein [Patescibacteria group bacterium]|nr:lamin tail domain-containing protein [Patescibacteria group bacterium]